MVATGGEFTISSPKPPEALSHLRLTQDTSGCRGAELAVWLPRRILLVMSTVLIIMFHCQFYELLLFSMSHTIWLSDLDTVPVNQQARVQDPGDTRWSKLRPLPWSCQPTLKAWKGK